MEPATPSLTERLALLLQRPVAAGDRERAALHVLDWVGCAVAGRVEAAGCALANHAAIRPSGPSVALGSGRLDAEAACAMNAGLGSLLEMDDVHREAVLHPGPVVVPAALAAAERVGAGGRELLDAVIRGYEAMIRIGRAAGPGHYRFFHPTATMGPFGAAAACADLRGLNPRATASALGLAGTTTGGLWQLRHEDCTAKPVHNATAARAGLAAADLVAAGLSGPLRILEGPQGLIAATCPDAAPERVVLDRDAPWLIHAVSFKPWPACRHAHPAIDAALAVREALGDAPIERVELSSYADALRFCDRPVPTTPQEARFSLQHAVAVTLLDGPPPIEAFLAESLGRPSTVALRERVTVAVDPAIDGRYPARYGARIVVTTTGGRTFAREIPDALGDPENPLSERALIGKASALMRFAGLDERRAGRVRDAALELAAGGPVAALTDELAEPWERRT